MKRLLKLTGNLWKFPLMLKIHRLPSIENYIIFDQYVTFYGVKSKYHYPFGFRDKSKLYLKAKFNRLYKSTKQGFHYVQFQQLSMQTEIDVSYQQYLRITCDLEWHLLAHY